MYSLTAKGVFGLDMLANEPVHNGLKTPCGGWARTIRACDTRMKGKEVGFCLKKCNEGGAKSF